MTSERDSERGAADSVGRPMLGAACESAPFVAAEEACIEDTTAVAADSEGCDVSPWYYRNNDLTTTTVALSSSASISLNLTTDTDGICVNTADPDYRFTASEFATVLYERSPMLADIEISNGVVVQINEVQEVC